MTIQEMHNEFKLLLDKGDSFDAPSFLVEEIDAFLNIAQHKFVNKRAFGNNTRRTSFEEDQKRRDDLRNLVTNGVRNPGSPTSQNKPNGRFVGLPSDYRHSINEECILRDGSVVGVKPITHDRYNKIIDDPFNKPNLNIVYRLDYNGDRFELIFGEGVTPATDGYRIRYIKTPTSVNFAASTDCILSEHTHKEIVKMAVVEALENVEQPRYQTSKIELNEIE